MTRGPLGFPAGSVRALLALCVVFVSCWLIVQGEEPPLAVSEALFTALGYYFATRARVGLSKAELQERQEEFGDEAEVRPLFLPRGSIRVIIIVCFAGVAGWMLYEWGCERVALCTTLLLVFAFFAGQALKHLVLWLRPRHKRHRIGRLEHVKAAIGIVVAAAFVAMYVSGYYRAASPRVHKVFLGFIIFYFGSR